VSVPSSELGPPTPSPAASVYPSLNILPVNLWLRSQHSAVGDIRYISLRYNNCLSSAQPNRLLKHIHSVQQRVNVKYV
jgi:hypothetical protein